MRRSEPGAPPWPRWPPRADRPPIDARTRLLAAAGIGRVAAVIAARSLSRRRWPPPRRALGSPIVAAERRHACDHGRVDADRHRPAATSHLANAPNGLLEKTRIAWNRSRSADDRPLVGDRYLRELAVAARAASRSPCRPIAAIDVGRPPSTEPPQASSLFRRRRTGDWSCCVVVCFGRSASRCRLS